MTLSVFAALLVFVACEPKTEAPDAVEASTEPADAAAEARALWDEGLRLERAGDLIGALEQFRRAIDHGPYVEAWRYYFGVRFIRARPLEEIEAYFRAALENDPKPQTTHYLWAAALVRYRRYAEAAKQIEQALAADPAHEMSYELLGDLHAAEGRVEEALAAYARALEIHPELASSHLRRARLLESLDRIDEAREHRTLASRSDPNTPRRFFYWGRALLREGRFEAAIAELEQALRIDPSDAEAQALLEQARARSNDRSDDPEP